MKKERNRFAEALRKLGSEVRAGVAKTRPMTADMKKAISAAVQAEHAKPVAEKLKRVKPTRNKARRQEHGLELDR